MVDKSNPKALEDHLGGIKERLVLFSRQRPHGPELIAEMRRALADASETSFESRSIMTQDEFIHCRRLRCSNRRILDHFIETDKLLSEEDRRNLDGYRDYHLGVLEIVEHRDHSIFVRNLINGWQGEVRANKGVEMMRDAVPAGSHMVSALVYFGDDVWLSGCQTMLGRSRQKALEFAVTMANHTPSLTVRGNRERVRAGFAKQAERHKLFVEYFGSDYVLCAPVDFGSTMEALESFCMEHTRGADGLTLKERALANGDPEQGAIPKLPRMELPEEMREFEQVVICSTSAEGVSIDVGSPPICAALKTGNLKAVMKHGKRLRQLITSPEVPPTPLRIMAGNFPELFAAAVKQTFSFRTFDVSKDLEPLLFRYKGMGTEPPRYPTLTVLEPGDPVCQAVYGAG